MTVRALLPGWTHTNILLQRGAEMWLVLKVPASAGDSASRYRRLFGWYHQLAEHRLFPTPLEFGVVSHVETFPYMILEYVPGRLYSSPCTISSADMSRLLGSLSSFWRVEVSDVPRYNTPVDYLGQLTRTLDDFALGQLGSEIAQQTRDCLESLRDLCPSIEWCSDSTIHGDLSETNIVFAEDRVVFLDPENLAIADPVLDVAYLSIQAEHYECPDIIPRLLPKAARRGVEGHISLALMTVITWSLERLTLIDSGRVASRLSTDDIRGRIIRYVLRKLNYLTRVLEKGLSDLDKL